MGCRHQAIKGMRRSERSSRRKKNAGLKTKQEALQQLDKNGRFSKPPINIPA